ncbi:MAG TPA: CBS domain-containing protein [Burkholderiales bacterium]|nr:CBS domain-containing protein [Burkholderiales bacterium]
MIIRDILTDKGNQIYSVAPDTSVAEAAAFMIEKDISSVLVLRGGAMAGLVTLRELLRGLHRLGGNVVNVPVSEIMVASPVTGEPEDSVDRMRQLMTENHITHLPVLEKGKLIGILSFQDVARSMVKDVALENQMLKKYIKNWPDQGQPKT